MASTPSSTAISSLSGLFGGGGQTGTTAGSGNPGGGNEIMPAMGSNQYSQYPATPGTNNTPGIVPSSSTLPGSGPNTLPYAIGGQTVPGTHDPLVPTYDPGYTNQFYTMLQQMLGQGLPSFNLSTALPGGGNTQAGQLNAPLNSTLQGVQQFLAGGQSNTPGANQLQTMAQTGDPVDQTAAWKAMIGSEQQNIQQNQADLKEQFAFGGALGGSEFGNAMQNYEQGVTATQNAQLTGATATAEENAMNRMMAVDQGLQGEAQQFGTGLQGLQQGAIQNMLSEFNYTLPQNNPLMGMFSNMATASPGTAQNNATAVQKFATVMGGLGSLI